jgi:fibronectin-binding autotransporter adhesin
MLNGNSTYTGGTTISGGTLQFGKGGTSGNVVGNVTNKDTLAFNRSDTVTFDNDILGTVAVNQIGPGIPKSPAPKVKASV